MPLPATTMSEVWCLLINNRKKPNLGCLFSVNMPANPSVTDLKKMVMGEVPHKLEDIDANDFVVWRCEVPATTFSGADEQSCEEHVEKAFSDGKGHVIGDV